MGPKVVHGDEAKKALALLAESRRHSGLIILIIFAGAIVALGANELAKLLGL